MKKLAGVVLLAGMIAGGLGQALPAKASAAEVVHQTIVVKKGQTYDGKGKHFKAGSEIGDGSQREDQKPLFKVEDGATLKNVVLDAPAADGVHTYGNVSIQNVVWTDIGEDALTVKKQGNVTIDGGSARNGSDKVFQINQPSTFTVKNFTSDNAGKFIRQNGGTTFNVKVFIDNCTITNMKEAIFRTDSNTSSVVMTNTRYSHVGKKWYGVKHITEKNNKEF
ncbi:MULTISPECIES: pectate lyase [Bacillus]|uniref:pectate lyase n=2 Tax=Bacillaceae TaxID=186817 RepID=UPI00098B1B82|nr:MULTISPECIES: pectate lyase [Bacillus]WFA05908.1 pectate lyase [Bacillus sp. HSf4]